MRCDGRARGVSAGGSTGTLLGAGAAGAEAKGALLGVAALWPLEGRPLGGRPGMPPGLAGDAALGAATGALASATAAWDCAGGLRLTSAGGGRNWYQK